MGATIVVADDEAMIVDLVETVLEDEGHAVRRAADGLAALAHLERGGCDLLITDNMMPHLSGLQLIARLHARPDLAVPTILMSAARVAPPPPPLVLFLPKPFDLDDLVRAVEALLKPA